MTLHNSSDTLLATDVFTLIVQYIDMKKPFFTLASCCLLTVTTLFGQNVNTSKLLTSYVFSQLDANTGIVYREDSTTFSYNSENLLIEKVLWNISTLNPVWRLRDRVHAMIYNMEGNLLTEERQQRINNTWVNYARYTYYYDATGLKTRQVQDKWDSGTWILEDDTQWQYDTAGQLLSEISLSFEKIYTYNADGYVSTITTRHKDNNGWTNLTNDIYQYAASSNGLPASVIQQQWNINYWQDYYQFLYEYELTGNISNLTTQYWDGTIWVNGFNQSFLYNIDGNLIYRLDERTFMGVVMNDTQQTLSYDSGGDIILINSEQWYEGAWYHTFQERYHYNIISNTEDPDFSPFDVFPNPATSSITLRGEGYILANLYNPQGRLMLSQGLQGQSQETIQLGHLPSGNYLLQVIPKSTNRKRESKLIQIRN